jgi:hypothetical protein
MKRKRLFLILVAGAFVSAIAFAKWLSAGEPPSIPFDAWWGSDRPDFPLAKSEDDPSPSRLRSEHILGAEGFVFTMGVGSGLSGLDVFRVDAAGNAVYVFATGDSHGDWWRAEFTVAAPMVTHLRKLLVEIDYPSLKRAYHANVADGTQWCIRVDCAGIVKKMYCNNYFPAAAMRLAAAVGGEILPAHGPEIQKARRIWQATARSAAKGLWH